MDGPQAAQLRVQIRVDVVTVATRTFLRSLFVQACVRAPNVNQRTDGMRRAG